MESFGSPIGSTTETKRRRKKKTIKARIFHFVSCFCLFIFCIASAFSLVFCTFARQSEIRPASAQMPFITQAQNPMHFGSCTSLRMPFHPLRLKCIICNRCSNAFLCQMQSRCFWKHAKKMDSLLVVNLLQRHEIPPRVMAWK